MAPRGRRAYDPRGPPARSPERGPGAWRPRGPTPCNHGGKMPGCTPIGFPQAVGAPPPVTGAPPVRIAGSEVCMQAVLGRVAPMAKATGSTDRADSRTLADKAMDRYADGDEAAFGVL